MTAASLASLSVSEFAASLASDAPAPGGGSASAAAGAFGAALLEMVVGLTLGKEKYRASWEDLEPLADRLREARLRLLELVDEDTKAFDAVVAARRLPKESDEGQGGAGGARSTRRTSSRRRSRCRRPSSRTKA